MAILWHVIFPFEICWLYGYLHLTCLLYCHLII